MTLAKATRTALWVAGISIPNNFLSKGPRLTHLHFQIGRGYRDQYSKADYWGWAYFLEDGARGVNPHLYWAGGRGEVTCFEPNQTYKPGSLTYPVPCQLLTPYHNEVRPTVFTYPLLLFQSYQSLLH